MLIAFITLSGCITPEETKSSGVNFIITNTLDVPVSVAIEPVVNIERFENNSWIAIRSYTSFCGSCVCVDEDPCTTCPDCTQPAHTSKKLLPSEQINYAWEGYEYVRPERKCGEYPSECINKIIAPIGKYRGSFTYSRNEFAKVYSSEFNIPFDGNTIEITIKD